MNNQKRNLFQVGTPECAAFCALIAMVLAVLGLVFGFWKTVLIALLMLVGWFIGSVKDKKQWLKNLINRIFPEKNVVPYRETNEKVSQALREAREAEAEAEQEEPEPQDDAPIETPEEDE